jgi:hypothetical protein
MFCKVQLLHYFFFVFFLLFVFLGDVSHIVNKYVRNEIVYYIIKSRSVSFCAPEIEDRNAVEVDNWAKHKKTFYTE